MTFRAAGILAVASFFIAASCKHTTSSASSNGDFVIAFYNVENLFDTQNDPKTNDEDFTPEGKLKWTDERYQAKLKSISQVIDSLPGAFPAMMGLCEVENKRVLEDLVKQPLISKAGYQIIHQDSPDERGIDVAMLYDPSRVKVLYSKYTTINLPDSADSRTRDLLYVKVEVKGKVMHTFVNHWPSRGGGQLESEPKRVAVANVLHSLIEGILKDDPQANIFLMGDFNDYPSNKSIAEVLKAGNTEGKQLFNFMSDDEANKQGSHFYKGEWGPLDQMIVSQGLRQGKSGLQPEADAHYFMNDLVLFRPREGGPRPNRTYVGEDYKGGFSDHLAMYISIAVK